ncbi:hypothetical protein EVAR_65545_1 [Eumeta japonica]|uniref:Uncharacterized protein n=1 Tax=Eumeta variegata TaxID=151549 RepID=A0A4C1ZK45_EUMVA|nr:hypothetical protein EVAR_65545_1 [Eumeta japonica]
MIGGTTGWTHNKNNNWKKRKWQKFREAMVELGNSNPWGLVCRETAVCVRAPGNIISYLKVAEKNADDVDSAIEFMLDTLLP